MVVTAVVVTVRRARRAVQLWHGQGPARGVRSACTAHVPKQLGTSGSSEVTRLQRIQPPPQRCACTPARSELRRTACTPAAGEAREVVFALAAKASLTPCPPAVLFYRTAMETTAEAKLCWAKLTVTVKDIKGTGRKLLREVYGCATPGSLHAIMGPSGETASKRAHARCALALTRGCIRSFGCAHS